MSPLGPWAVLVAVVLVAALSFRALSNGPLLVSDSILPGHGENLSHIVAGRRLKEKFIVGKNDKARSDAHAIIVEDYPSYDPVPSSKAAVKPGPIEHGAPLLPYLPSPVPAPPAKGSGQP